MHPTMESHPLVYAILGVAFSPFIICVFLVIILASSGQSLGLRRLGLLILIKTFQFVSSKVREAELANRDAVIDRSGANNGDDDEGDDDDGDDDDGDNDDDDADIASTVAASDKERRMLDAPQLQIEGESKSFYISDGEEGNDDDEDDDDDDVTAHNSAATPDHNTNVLSPSMGSINAAPLVDGERCHPTEFADTKTVPSRQPDHLQCGSGSGGSDSGSGGISGRRVSIAKLPRVKSLRSLKREFHLTDVTSFAQAGVEAIIEDQVTSRFRAEELSTWNLLTRTNHNYQFRSKRLCALWCVGFFIRYFILFPFRLALALFGIGLLIVVTAVIGYLPPSKGKRLLNRYFTLVCYRILSRSFSAVITYHNRQHRAQPQGICVANHTTPIDVVVLSCDNAYAMVGQKHGGFLGLMQTALHRATDHVWFERSEAHDRLAVSRRLREHVEDAEKLPILIFPEGTCINNTSVMMFKKGSFDVGGTIHPVAIKYHPEFGDAFWNSSEQSMVTYMIMMMTSWAIVADVWYLPPMTRKPEEDAITFANRVKREICLQGGLVDLDWDGMLKRQRPKASLLAQAQQKISQRYNAFGIFS